MSNLYDFVNIIGYGYVGGAIGYLCKQNNVPYCTYDVLKKDEVESVKNFNDISSLIKHSEDTNEHNFYFICVPTPPRDDTGECDTSIVEHVLDQLFCETTRATSVIIKSTVKPGTSRILNNKYGKRLNIVFCPEFLREVSYKDAIYSAKFVLFGIDENQKNLINDLKDLFTNYLYKHKYTTNDKNLESPFEFYFKTFEECELFKYTLNTFFATKITFFNEIYELCNTIGVDYQNLKSLFKLDKRIGDYGTVVPGMDGFGYTRSCLPKEIRALIKLQEELGLSNDLASCVDKRNDYFRSK